MLNKNIETFLGCDNEYGESGLVIFGAPFDSTTSFRPGTRFAGRTMRGESYGLETYSPYQDKDLEDLAIFDGGDLELCFGDTEKALTAIESYTTRVLRDNKRPVMIGGEHLVTLGAVRAVAARGHQPGGPRRPSSRTGGYAAVYAGAAPAACRVRRTARHDVGQSAR